jgi:hypothetical protein
MKKLIVLSIVALLSLTVVKAQDALVSKNGIPILPTGGDIAIGIDAIPFFRYIGNMHSENDIVPSWDYKENFNIYGKYFLDDETAVRLTVNLTFRTEQNKAFVLKDGQTPVPDTTIYVEDIENIKSTLINIGGGLEKRRGYGRLQGFYGAELRVIFGSGGSDYTYGNGFSASNPNPTTYDFGTNITGPGQRVITTANGSLVGGGVRGFVGAEFFFAPKISLGGEFNWGVMYTMTGEGSATLENWDGSSSTVNQEKIKVNGGSDLNLSTGNLGGALYLLFHF